MSLATPASATPRPRAQRELRVVVVDDHHHVLPEIHLAIRRRVLPFEGVHVVHVDAHPDLSFSSSVLASTIFDPDRLYDALDESPSGIAEFLLPLVFAGHVDRVTWIKPHWATQMQQGDAMQQIAIGRSVAADRVVLSCPWTHFIEDDLYAPVSEMDPTTLKRWDLHVVELPAAAGLPPPTVGGTTTPWVLDIDLDYFSTWNPFRQNLETHFDAASMELLTRVFTGLRYRSSASRVAPDTRVRERVQFLQLLQRVERERLYDDATSPASCAVVAALLPLYTGPADRASTLLHAFWRLLGRAGDAARGLVWHAGPCLDLPHHETDGGAELDAMLDAFEAFVAAAASRPALVTVATSVSDRFLPPHQVDAVRSRVLAVLTRTLGPLRVDEIEYERV